MAEQPIKSSEIIDPKFLDEAIKKAEEFLVINKELTSVLKENLSVTQKSVSGSKINDSNDLKQQAQLTALATKELQQLEVLKQSAAKTEVALANVRIANDKALKQQIASEKAFEDALKRETKEQQNSSNAASRKINELQQYKRQLKEVSDRLELNTFKIKQNAIADTESGRSRIRTAALVAQAQKEMFTTVTEVEQGAGRFNRQVGDYKKAYDGLGNSVNQLTRELPAFAVSANTGFLAISNNLPIFFDQLQKINAENKVLIEQGKKTTSTLSQLGSAVFSVGTILSLGVTLLTLYGKELVTWVATLFEGEKALESITAANDAYNKSINQTKEDITDLTIQLKVQAGILTKNEGNLLRNENARTKALNANKELRNKSIADLKTETNVTDKLIGLEGKKRTIINDGIKEETDILTNSEKQKIKQYKDGLERINTLYKTSNEYIQEEYNLRGKIVETEKGSGGKKSAAKIKYDEEIDLRDKIRQLAIDDEKDAKQKELEQVKFDSEKAKREIDNIKVDNIRKKELEDKLQKEKITDDEKKQLEYLTRLSNQKIELQIALDKDRFNKEAEIELKYRKETDDKITEDFKKSIEARQKISTDNANAEIAILEKDYNERQKKLDGFDLQEINNKERAISAKKVVQIQAYADEKKALTDNNTEKLAIQNEADIAIEKETVSSQDKIKANRKIALDQALEFEQQLIDAVAKGVAEQSKERIAAYDNQIKDADKNIETQRKLAEKGAKNTLAEEEANKIKIQQEKEKEKQAEIKRQKALAFFKLFASYAEQDPDTALQKALRDTVLAEAVSAAFIDGTENVGQDAQFAKNKFNNGTDGYLARFDGDERILNPDQNKKIGNLSNEALADLAHKHNNGLLDTVKYAVMPNSGDFAKNVQDSATLHQMIQLNNKIASLEQTIKDRPTSNYSFNGYEFVTETIHNNNKHIKRQILKKPRI